VRKRYDTARTPYQRLLVSGVLDEGPESACACSILVSIRSSYAPRSRRLWRGYGGWPSAARRQTGQKVACG